MTIDVIECTVSGMECGGCSGRLSSMLSNISGVSNVSVDHVSGLVGCTIDTDVCSFGDIENCVKNAGFEVISGSCKGE